VATVEGTDCQKHHLASGQILDRETGGVKFNLNIVVMG
jgi:hypothetical protein